MIVSRRWFACWFLLVTIAAEVPHDHDQASPTATAFFEPCDQSSHHWDRHDPVPDEPGPDSCTICRHRLDQPFLAEPSAWPVIAGSLNQVQTASATSLVGFALRTRCRAPPLAV